MRRFETIHKSPYNGLRATMTNKENLQPAIDQFLNELKSTCDNLPDMEFSVEWSNMSTSTLAYTYTYFVPSLGHWKPANRFEVYFNPNAPWSNGTCGEMHPHHFDLKTAVMHEVLHGMGFLSTISANKLSYPTNYDLLLKNSGGSSLVSKNGQFNGHFGQPVYIENIRMYNPNTFESGSSFSHVHQTSRLMSWAQSACQQHLDYNTKVIMNQLGYGCLANGSLSRVTSGDSSGMIIGIAIGIVVLVGALVAAMTCKSKPTKEINKPLLSNKQRQTTIQF